MEAFWQKAGKGRAQIRKRVTPPIRHRFSFLGFIKEMKKKEIIEGAHKPSSVPLESRFERAHWGDGHLSRILIAQHLKRPYPSRLSPAE